MKNKICVVTGSRADYGILYPLLTKFKNCDKFDLQIVATGMHLCQEFGLTFKEIEKDGFKINEKVNINLSGDRAIVRAAVDWRCGDRERADVLSGAGVGADRRASVDDRRASILRRVIEL